MSILVLLLVAICAFSTAISVARRFQNAGPALLFGNAVGIAILALGFFVLTFATSFSLLMSPL
jgi:hypothetical protein